MATISSTGIWGTFLTTLESLAGSAAAGAATGGVSGGSAGGGSLASVVDFLGHLSDGAMWASIGWIVLGTVLLGAGLYMLVKGENLLPSGLPVPV